MGIEKEWIYAAALLHDLGRHVQYESGTPHAEAGAAIAPGILKECGFSEKETCVISKAIAAHGDKALAGAEGLGYLLCKADKASRACFACGAEPDCRWPADKKNRTLKY